jgi:uncharacterized YccA/Bax inhibitor family protein
MALFKSGNPTLKENTFDDLQSDSTEVMTLQGTVNKTAIMLLMLFASALYTWNMFMRTLEFSTVMPLFIVGLLGGFILSLIIVFKKNLSPYLAPPYAVLEGLFLGGLSAIMNHKFPGIVIQAMVLTFGIFGVLLLIYKLRIIRVTENFKLIVASATGGIALYYLASWILSYFNINLPFIHESGTAGIIFSLVVIVIASMNLVVDFDFIERGAEQRAPKYMEWYGAFGLLVTLIWLYIEILRLLSKLKRN